jgi:hypothetical protein
MNCWTTWNAAKRSSMQWVLGPPAAVPGLAGQPRGEGFDLPVTVLRPGQVAEATPSYAAPAVGGMGYHEAGSPGVAAGIGWCGLAFARAVSSVAYVRPRSGDGAATGQRVRLRQRMRAALKLLFGPAKTAGG